MINYLPTGFVWSVEGYPYGFRLKTTATFAIEFKKKNGFRTVFQTVNPKTWKLNKPKKSTYSDLMFMYKNEAWHYKYSSYDLNVTTDKLNWILDIIEKNKELFTDDQLEYLSNRILMSCKVWMIALVQYCWASLEDLKPLYKDFIEAINKLDFASTRLDHEAIENTKVEWYQPFKVTTYTTL